MSPWRSPFGFAVEFGNSNIPNQKAERLLFRLVAAMPRYVKKAHIGMVPGIVEYTAKFATERAWGQEGYLTGKGLIPMPDAERQKFAEDAKTLPNLAL